MVFDVFLLCLCLFSFYLSLGRPGCAELWLGFIMPAFYTYGSAPLQSADSTHALWPRLEVTMRAQVTMTVAKLLFLNRYEAAVTPLFTNYLFWKAQNCLGKIDRSSLITHRGMTSLSLSFASNTHKFL